MNDLSFYKGKRVFVTGHTGFKGTWLCQMLVGAGAQVTGYSLQPPTDPSLFALSGLENRMNSMIGDVRDYDYLLAAFREAKPEIVLHLAAQPIVRESYRTPRETYETNVMGTVNLLECVRVCGGVKSVLNVTTDKVYHNNEWAWGYRENEPLDGFDPYSNSKSCSELATHSYKNSFFANGGVAVSTARAGNVIGGGDFAPNRIIPDCVRAAVAKQPIVLRNPYSIRPYQHVLEPLIVYLTIAMRQYENPELAGSYNVGPDLNGCVTPGELAKLFCDAWGEDMQCRVQPDGGPHEAAFLKLDCELLKKTFGWKPTITVSEAVGMTVEWTKAWLSGASLTACMTNQIAKAINRAN